MVTAAILSENSLHHWTTSPELIGQTIFCCHFVRTAANHSFCWSGKHMVGPEIKWSNQTIAGFQFIRILKYQIVDIRYSDHYCSSFDCSPLPCS
jgi:hypothetical protein